MDPSEPNDDLEFFERLPRNMVKNTMRILGQEDAVLKLDPDHWDVVSLRTPSRRVRVYRRGDLIRCRSDKKGNNQDQPCSHILAVMVKEGMVELPNTAAQVFRKTNQDRDYSLEERAWRAVPAKVRELLARLLREGLPVIAPEEPETGGRPRTPLSSLVYQAVMRVAERRNLRSLQGAMDTPTHLQHNPYGGVSKATISRFLADPSTGVILEKLLALSTWPARPYESLVHPDGTGLTEQRFGSYFDERYAKERKEGPRKHHWTYAEILWTYRYTMIAAIHTQQGPFGEAPWLIPLLERARLMLDIGELGGDKAYVAAYIFDYAARNGIDPQIKFKDNTNPTRSHARIKAFKRTFERSLVDPKGYAAKANRRNNAETGNHALKMVLGDKIFSKDAVAQRHEVLCMCIAYNLMRMVLLSLDQDVEPSFAGGAQVLADAEWVHLSTLHKRFKGRSTPAPP